jgi:hypothetical protein
MKIFSWSIFCNIISLLLVANQLRDVASGWRETIMNRGESNAFGFSCDTALLYSLDNFSNPDNWYDLGYELQYDLVVFFHKIVRDVERAEFLIKLASTFSHSFSVPQNHVTMGLVSDDSLSDLLEGAFGVPLDEGNKLQPPFDNLRGLQFRVIWNKGRLDLRMLKRLENEIDSEAKLNHACVALANLIIIPRSAETITAKLKEISASED